MGVGGMSQPTRRPRVTLEYQDCEEFVASGSWSARGPGQPRGSGYLFRGLQNANVTVRERGPGPTAPSGLGALGGPPGPPAKHKAGSPAALQGRDSQQEGQLPPTVTRCGVRPPDAWVTTRGCRGHRTDTWVTTRGCRAFLFLQGKGPAQVLLR